MTTHTTPAAPPIDAAVRPEEQSAPAATSTTAAAAASDSPREVGGPKGPEPTRYNDWERNGRCSDF